jgi:hypothetical protein
LEETKMAMTQAEMNKDIIFANMGDKVRLHTGEIVEFIKLNRSKFVFKRDGVAYNIAITAFNEIVEKAPLKKINQSYKKLKEGELFYIVHKEEAMVYSFLEIAKGKIVGKNPILGSRTSIDINLYGGKLAELKKSIAE